ncbi:MAG: hypothetical protein IKA84_00500 [Clostridia bacterium]|nr:hypothetical protein [Clostridia bacterium]
MKKLLFLLLTFVIVLSLASCDLSLKHEHIQDEKWSFNSEIHWKDVTCTWNMCKFDIVTYEHIDEDNDLFCDVCGYEMSINTEACNHQWDDGVEVESEVGGYVMEYTCSLCGSKRRETITIPPEENHFLRNQAGCEWLRKISAEDIAEVKIINEYVGVAPGNLKNIESSKNEAIIERIFEECYLCEVLSIPADKGQLDGGGAVTVKFILKDGTAKKLYINNGNYCDSEGNYFELLYRPQFEENDKTRESYGFITYIGTGTVYDGDNNLVCELSVDELEFEYDVDLELPPDLEPYNYVLKTEFGDLLFITPDIFYMETKGACVLVGKNLNELIADATAIEYSVTMNDEEWLYEDLQSTYKSGEMVSVKIKMALDMGYLFLVNGENIATCSDVDGLYWVFTFTMPQSDVVIDFKTYDGFLPDANYSVLIEEYWMKHLDAPWVSIRFYYGEFASGAIVAMIDAGGYTDVEWEEVVGGYTFEYSDSNRITVLYEGEFYTLEEAYMNGYLTNDDLAKIAE